MTNNHIIMWEKWHDPFGMDDFDNENNNDDLLYNNDYDNDIDSLNSKKIKSERIQVIATPFGIIPVNENTASGKIFNFWTGHTNFPLTRNVCEIIENTEGIETFNVFTKYRFRISVGKAFEDSVVMREINSNVYKYLEE